MSPTESDYRDVWEYFSNSPNGSSYLGKPVKVIAEIQKIERAGTGNEGWIVTLSQGKNVNGGYVCRCPEREADYLRDLVPGDTFLVTGTVRAWRDNQVHLDDCYVHNFPSSKR